ncbi:MAG: HAD family hydrolase [Lachnospiraceae bacterium]|nr:HAD family hydrolase [Lachnospiraceae bacterium]
MADFKVIIFDFDGTLADTREAIVRAKQETIRRMGLPPRTDEECAATIGLTAPLGFLKLYEGLPEPLVEKSTKMYRELFEHFRKALPPVVFPHVRETLQALQEAGCVLTVASSRNTPSLQDFLEILDLKDFFTLVLGAGDTAKYKPDPEPVLETLRRLEKRKPDTETLHRLRERKPDTETLHRLGEEETNDLQPAEVLVVGDMPFDILMGSRAGVKTCGVTYGNATADELWEAGADYVIDDMKDLADIVLK